ncbi:MAG TPA: NAD(P)H-dependent oxidoreductase [Burkholderiaceae bacterium]|jgi:NAD(P)H-dependent FMN reductase|nr:NAD(P)H-dependent oxidoreductase [Burkholderiaceae bacterium]
MSAPERTLLIVWWSVTGASRALAQAACEAARESGECKVTMMSAPQATPADLRAADGYLFVMPEMLGSMAGQMKDLFDRSYYDLQGAVEGRPYALIVCAGSDGTGAVRQLERIVTGWRLRRIADARIVCTHAQTPEAIAAPKVLPAEELEAAGETGRALAMGLAMGLW